MLHLITCHGRIMPHLAELMFSDESKIFFFFQGNPCCVAAVVPCQTVSKT